jgi:hypothetical protein
VCEGIEGGLRSTPLQQAAIHGRNLATRCNSKPSQIQSFDSSPFEC